MPNSRQPFTDESPGTGEGWSEYRKLVLSKLDDNKAAVERTNESVTGLREEINAALHKIRNQVQTVMVDVAMLKVKASIWGGLGGALVALGVLLLSWAKR